ncbi:hypothetical protein FRC03_011982 [Tulasnella sp. 419]|nr:hypothetical protein FRC03_011982 [Tulasnella sp. 419]
MDRFFASTSPEARAKQHINEYVFYDSSIGPTEVGLCAAYTALARYVDGQDVYVPPRNYGELQKILRLYSDHVINSLFTQIPSRAPRDGYATARNICAQSLHTALSQNSNAEYLISLHTSPADDQYDVTHVAEAIFDCSHPATPTRIKTK